MGHDIQTENHETGEKRKPSACQLPYIKSSNLAEAAS